VRRGLSNAAWPATFAMPPSPPRSGRARRKPPVRLGRHWNGIDRGTASPRVIGSCSYWLGPRAQARAPSHLADTARIVDAAAKQLGPRSDGGQHHSVVAVDARSALKGPLPVLRRPGRLQYFSSHEVAVGPGQPPKTFLSRRIRPPGGRNWSGSRRTTKECGARRSTLRDIRGALGAG